MINLQKKQTYNLVKNLPTLNKIKVGLSWDQNQINGQYPDCDVSVFMLGENGKLPSEQFFVFYNNLQSGDGAVKHNGDNRTGAGEGDDETVDITLNDISNTISQIIFTISINNSDIGFDFSTVANACVKIYNCVNNQIICQYKLNETYPDSNTLDIGRCYRTGNEWEFEALGYNYNGGLEAALSRYGT